MLKQILTRWQEWLGWLPITIGLAVLAWLVLGALIPYDSSSALGAIIELAVLIAHGLAAAGILRLVWRRWRLPITDAEKERYWSDLMAGRTGAIVVHVVNAVFVLCALGMLLLFFSPAR